METGTDWYGWTDSYDVGDVFTDGFAIVKVTGDAEGPLRLVSATPVTSDEKVVDTLGVRVRLLGCGLSDADTQRAFNVLDGFPPSDPVAAGSVPLAGFEVPTHQDTPAGEDCGRALRPLYINVFIGYEVTAEGESTREGTELVYEYNGERRLAVIENRMTVCVPADLDCELVRPGGP